MKITLLPVRFVLSENFKDDIEPLVSTALKLGTAIPEDEEVEAKDELEPVGDTDCGEEALGLLL